MRVLHLCKYDFRSHNGGIESVCKSMYEYFKTNDGSQSGSFHFFLFFSLGKISTEQQEGQFHFYTAGTNYQLGSTPLSILYVKKYLELCNKGFDIIHVHVPNPIALLALYIKPPRAKIVVHWHSDIVKQKIIYLFFKVIEQHVLRRTAAIIATSKHYIDGSIPLASHHHKIKIIPIGIHGLKASSTQEKSQQSIHILSVGRLVYYKGFEYLIKASAYLPESFHITIIGNGDLHNKLQQLINNMKLQDRITLAGKVSDTDLAKLMNRCSVFCLPSIERSEAFGVVLLEALSLGKPVVTTNIAYSGVNWVNQHGETGLNVMPKDEKELAKAIIAILSDGLLYQQLSKNASNRFNTLFTDDKMNHAIKDLYIGVCSKAIDS